MGNKNSKKNEPPLPLVLPVYVKPLYPVSQSVDEGYVYFQQRLIDMKENTKIISDEISTYVKTLSKKTLYDILLKCVENNDVDTLNSLSRFSDMRHTLVIWNVHYTINDIVESSLRHPFQCITASSSPKLVRWICENHWFSKCFPYCARYEYNLFKKLLDKSGDAERERELIRCLCLPLYTNTPIKGAYGLLNLLLTKSYALELFSVDIHKYFKNQKLVDKLQYLKLLTNEWDEKAPHAITHLDIVITRINFSKEKVSTMFQSNLFLQDILPHLIC